MENIRGISIYMSPQDFVSTRQMTNKQEWNKRHKYAADTSHSRSDIAKISKVPRSVLDDVYERGVGAHATNPQSVRLKGTFKKDASAPISKKLSAEQWGTARVYSFVNKIEGRRKLNHDLDLAAKIKKPKK